METAMQELIDWIECDNDNNVYDITDFAKELLEKEKEQILAAYNNGSQDMALEEKYEPLEYYNKTYNQKK